jgi:methionyl-tRNA synthetase
MSEEQNDQNQEQEENNLIDIETFMKVELRVGKILTCEKLPKSRKLLKMEVDLGSETRQILAGLAPWFIPEEMVGRRVAVVANLKPAKLMGMETQGMILAASPEHEGAVPVPVAVAEGIPIGARIR